MSLKDAAILIVDDEVDLLSIFRVWFEREGCRVLTAENGEQALELLRMNTAEVIITDIRMPKVDGIELAKRIKETGKYYPKIIFVSGYADIDDRDCLDLGVEMKFSKPIQRATLVSAVQTILTPRDELWQKAPADAAQKVLEATFESLQGAQDRGMIAFGRGGFCVHSRIAVQVGDTIGLDLEFAADHYSLAGQGIVRWAMRNEQQIGIEITYIDAPNRPWVVSLSQRNELLAFIPRSCHKEKSLVASD